MCVQMTMNPNGKKMDGKEQTLYPRKNWSSLFYGIVPILATSSGKGVA